MAGSTRRGRRSPAERRAEHAQVEDVGTVVEAALRFLEPRARSTAEVRRRLGSAGYPSELVETALGRLTDVGVLDDETFARDWVRSRDRAHPRGERALRSELRAKGIANEIIEIVLAERIEPQGGEGSLLDPEEDAAVRLLERKATLLRRSGEPRQIRQRAYALLVRNGFASELAWRIAATLTDREEDPAE